MAHGRVEHLNPDGLHRNPAYSQVVVSNGNVRTVMVGGQNAVDASGEVVGRGDLAGQARQVLRNLETALDAGGASIDNVVKWNVYIVQGQPLEQGFAAFQQVWGERPDPPLITVLYVAGLAHPDFLLEMDAVALVPEE